LFQINTRSTRRGEKLRQLSAVLRVGEEGKEVGGDRRILALGKDIDTGLADHRILTGEMPPCMNAAAWQALTEARVGASSAVICPLPGVAAFRLKGSPMMNNGRGAGPFHPARWP